MKKKTKNKLINVYLPLSLIILSSFAFIFIVSDYSFSDDEVADRNYLSEVYLGVSPNMPSHTPTKNDIDTQLNFKDTAGNIYRLYESRDFISYGKTFLVKVG